MYPCLVLAYMGEAAYLSKHREDLQSSFYKALPGEVPMFQKIDGNFPFLFRANFTFYIMFVNSFLQYFPLLICVPHFTPKLLPILHHLSAEKAHL